MGGHVEVPTPEGTVTIEVPAGTQTGQRSGCASAACPARETGGAGTLGEARRGDPAATDDRARALLRSWPRSCRGD